MHNRFEQDQHSASRAAIKVQGVSKKFTADLSASLAYGATDLLRSALNLKWDARVLRKREFWAVSEVSFEIKRGEIFGIIGANGSGKSTLLRIISGIFYPDFGTITIEGRLGSLIALGAGFHPHMSGRENIYLNAALLGMSAEETNEKLNDIIQFADIGDFLEAPVSTYSSGMYVRLGFAIAIHSKADILLIDEILAVGDQNFQRKCLNRLQLLHKEGKTFVIVSHNLQLIEGICDRVVLLDRGKQVRLGKASEVIPEFELLLGERTGNAKPSFVLDRKAKAGLSLVKKYSAFGTDEIAVEEIQLRSHDGKINNDFRCDEPVTIQARLAVRSDIDFAWLWLSFIYVTQEEEKEKEIVTMGAKVQLSLKIGPQYLEINLAQLQLTTGRYKIAFHIFDKSFTNPYTQGHYGYFVARNSVPTQLRVGDSTPMVWIQPNINLSTSAVELESINEKSNYIC